MTAPRMDWTDIDFTAIANLISEHVVEYAVYEIEGVTAEGAILWHRAGATSWPDPVADLTQAEIYLHGSVKWDGCSNWYFDEQDRIMLHGCTRQDLVNLGEVLARCWEWTRELLPSFEGEKAEVTPFLTTTSYGKQIAGSVIDVAVDHDGTEWVILSQVREAIERGGKLVVGGPEPVISHVPDEGKERA